MCSVVLSDSLSVVRDIAVKHDCELSTHSRCGCTSAAWFKRSFGMHAYMLQYVNPFPCHLFTSLAKMFTDVSLCVIFKLPHPLPPWQFGFQCLRWPIQRRICLRLSIKRRISSILVKASSTHRRCIARPDPQPEQQALVLPQR